MTEEIAAGPAPSDRSRRLGPLRQWPLLLVLLGLTGSLVAVMVMDDFRPGAMGFGATMLAAGVLRLCLPERVAGLLAVRARALDVVTLFLLGGCTLTLALVIPELG